MKNFTEFMKEQRLNEGGDVEPQGPYAKVWKDAQKQDYEPKVLAGLKKALIDMSDGTDESEAYKKQRTKFGIFSGDIKKFFSKHDIEV